MRPGTAPRRGLVLLLAGMILAACPVRSSAAPEEVAPTGFVWEKLPALRATILRPESWFYRCVLPGFAFYECSPQPFTEPIQCLSGVMIHVLQRAEQPADEMAAARVAQIASRGRVLRGWTRKNAPAEPFTTYGVVVVLNGEETNGVKCTYEFLLIANRTTNAVYQCSLCAPTLQWKEVEPWGETMLNSLRPDPAF